VLSTAIAPHLVVVPDVGSLATAMRQPAWAIEPFWPLGQAGRAKMWAGLGPPLFGHLFFFCFYSIFFPELNF
jgi:hypothetical protein